jgi:uncharacterized protein (DUF433 family)
MNIIESNPEILDGTLVFGGTRVPVQTLFDHLRAGDPMDNFLIDFPTVCEDKVIAVLEVVRDCLLDLTQHD